MHIPENYLSPSTCGVLGAVMVPIWAAVHPQGQGNGAP
jgi:ABC-type Co2+ transport system permease subunit